MTARRWLLSLTAALLLSSVALTRPDSDQAALAQRLREDLSTLASDAFLGREAGAEGSRKAAEFIKGKLKALGLEGIGEAGSYSLPFSANRRDMCNLAVVIRGTDSDARAIVVGAHYDHVGMGGGGSLAPLSRGQVHNGADDNASGTSALLELARALSKGPKLRRDVVLVFFDGEEQGLLGSKAFVKAEAWPRDATAAMVNMDMVGRLGGKPLTVYGSGTGSTFEAALAAASETVDLKLDLKNVIIPNSDHASFYDKQIPSIALFTGLHGDYHRPSDDADKVDYAGLASITRFAELLVRDLASSESDPEFAKAADGRLEMMTEQLRAMLGDRFDEMFKGRAPTIEELSQVFRDLYGRGRRGGRPRFGVSIGRGDGPGVVISEVSPGSIAEAAGVRPGDAIVAFGDEEIKAFEDLRAAVQGAKGEVTVTLLREGERVEVRAQFGEAAPTTPEAAPAPAAPKPKLY